MKIENIKKRMENWNVIDDTTLSAEEAERQNREQNKIQRAFDAQYDW